MTTLTRLQRLSAYKTKPQWIQTPDIQATKSRSLQQGILSFLAKVLSMATPRYWAKTENSFALLLVNF